MPRHKVFLPQIGNGPTEPPGTTADPARTVFDLLRKHPQQGRESMTWHAVLAKVALAKCKDMAERGYFSHTDLNGHGPNYLLRKSGYRLPDYYGTDDSANYVESILYGTANAKKAFDVWLGSPGHRIHLLAESEFYAGQTNVGIGFHQDPASQHKYYWVALTAHPEG